MKETFYEFFNKGWRPAFGWVTAISIFFYFVPQYLIACYLWAEICHTQHQILPFPVNATPILELTGLLLGIYGTQRTLEKIKGVEQK